MDNVKISSPRLGKDYLDHQVFECLHELSEFYIALSDTTFRFPKLGVKAAINLDTFVFTSVSGTLKSIQLVLSQGRVNDAYALLRKYYDSTIINIYTNLYLEDHFDLNNFIVEQIEGWRSGEKSIPEYRIISRYIKESKKLQPITALLHKDQLYKKIRERCNDHTHYNYFHNLLINDNQIYSSGRIGALDGF